MQIFHSSFLISFLTFAYTLLAAGLGNVAKIDEAFEIGIIGSWGYRNEFTPNGTFNLARVSGINLIFNFTGTAVYFISPLFSRNTWPEGVSSLISLDGGEPVRVDLVSANNETSAVRWYALELANVTHTVSIICGLNLAGHEGTWSSDGRVGNESTPSVALSSAYLSPPLSLSLAPSPSPPLSPSLSTSPSPSHSLSSSFSRSLSASPSPPPSPYLSTLLSTFLSPSPTPSPSISQTLHAPLSQSQPTASLSSHVRGSSSSSVPFSVHGISSSISISHPITQTPIATQTTQVTDFPQGSATSLAFNVASGPTSNVSEPSVSPFLPPKGTQLSLIQISAIAVGSVTAGGLCFVLVASAAAHSAHFQYVITFLVRICVTIHLIVG